MYIFRHRHHRFSPDLCTFLGLDYSPGLVTRSGHPRTVPYTVTFHLSQSHCFRRITFSPSIILQSFLSSYWETNSPSVPKELDVIVHPCMTKRIIPVGYLSLPLLGFCQPHEYYWQTTSAPHSSSITDSPLHPPRHLVFLLHRSWDLA